MTTVPAIPSTAPTPPAAAAPPPSEARVVLPAGSHTAASVLRRARRGQLRHLGASSFFLSCHQVAEALVPVTIGLAVDRAIATGDGDSMARWLAALLGLFVALTCSMRWGFRANLRAVQGAGHDLRMLVADRVLDPRGGAGSDQLPGQLVALATGDALKVGMLNYATAMAVSGVAGVGVAVVSLARFSLPLTGLVVAGTLLLMVITHVLGRPLERRSGAERATMAAATGLAADLIAGLRVLKGFGGERPAVDRYRAASRRALGATLRAAATESTIRAVAVMLAGGLLAVVTLVAGRLAADGSISIGALITALGLAQFLVDPLNRITGFGAQRAQSAASAGRIASVLDAPWAVLDPARPAAGTTGTPGSPPLRLAGVTVGSVRDLDLEVRAGEFLGVVAADPREAAAVLAVLARDADPESGVVLLDGRPVTELPPDTARAAVLVAPHDSVLFDGTVADNIRSAAAEGDDLGPVVTAAGLDDLAEVLPDGLGTSLASGGVSLSGGQRQRVALARALAAQAPVLVLHEPTTAVDSLTERRIADGVRGLRSGLSTVCVTSSPAVLASCDRVVLLDGGRVTADGTHAELVRSDPRYRELVLA
ncbi:putative ABC transport system ATP-binding protein [Frankia sp. EI5c]|uniref:ABC transporter ATP-binding protein n=1 Tax=Frankia sp. EI5c TaxID=683316 RepID=UPI0007C251C8|nr:ABC transporter ATP-binding protein [Frankia sp. EI5c]OAA18720.1 putative ABC transport system ATP-binding protein [Frankia sp. EI5c]